MKKSVLNSMQLGGLTLLIWLGLSPIAAIYSQKSERLNFVFAFADDWGQQAGAYAKIRPGTISDAAKTPNFDALAEQGVLFTQAFVNAPSCTPCRSSLFSGRNFWETGRGAILQGAIWDDSIPTFPNMLESSGYHVGFSNKAWTPGSPAHRPIGGNRNQYNQAGGNFNRFSQFVTANRNDIDTAKQKLSDEVKGNFEVFLNKRGETKPFLYFWGPTNVHRKWVQGSGKELWGIEPDSLKGKVPAFLPDSHIVREDLADYLGEAAAFDFGLGVLIEELKTRGMLEKTVIIVSGDHGPAGFTNGKCSLYDFGTKVPLLVRMPNGENGGRIVDDLISIPDVAPTILKLAGIEPHKTMTAKSFVEILTSQKSGLVDPKREFVVCGRERHVAAARTDFLPYPQRSIRTQDFLLIKNFQSERWPMGTGPEFGTDAELPTYEQLEKNTFAAWADLDASPTKAWIAHNCQNDKLKKYFDFAFGRRPRLELYDLQKDPDQIVNLAKDEAHAETVKALEERLMAYLKRTNDPRLSENPVFENPPFTDPVNRKPNPKKK